MLAIEPKSLNIGDYIETVDPVPAFVPLPQWWFVLRLRPNRENKVEGAFTREGISYFLPRFSKNCRIPAGTNRVMMVARRVPLFPGLVFIPDFEVRRRRVNDVVGVVSYLRFGEKIARLSPKFMSEVERMVNEANRPISKVKAEFRAGQALRVTSGPFEGWRGRFARLDGKGRIRVLLKAVKREIEAIVAEDQVEPDCLRTRGANGETW